MRTLLRLALSLIVLVAIVPLARADRLENVPVEGYVHDNGEVFAARVIDEPGWERADGGPDDRALYTYYYPGLKAWTMRVDFGAMEREGPDDGALALLRGDRPEGGNVFDQCREDRDASSSPRYENEDVGFRQVSRLIGCSELKDDLGGGGLVQLVRVSESPSGLFYALHTWRTRAYAGEGGWPLPHSELELGNERALFFACDSRLVTSCPDHILRLIEQAEATDTVDDRVEPVAGR